MPVSSDVSIGNNITAAQFNSLRADASSLITKTSVEVTISSGAISFATGQAFYSVDTESDDATDDLDTISGGAEGDIVVLIPEDTARVVTLKDGTGNLSLSDGDIEMDADCTGVVLIKLSGGDWRELSRSLTGGGGGSASGIIMLASAACPSGWTRFSPLSGSYDYLLLETGDKILQEDGSGIYLEATGGKLFPKGAAAYGGIGGTDTHTHTYSDVPSHGHTVGTLATVAVGGHSHTIKLYESGGAILYVTEADTTDQSTYATSSTGGHTHTVSGSTASTGDAEGTSSATDHKPSYLDMIFCKMD